MSEHGFKIYWEGPSRFFVVPPSPEFETADAPRKGEGYLLDLELASTRVSILNKNQEGIVIHYDGTELHTDLVVQPAGDTCPDLNSPVEEMSLELCETDPWLCDKAFEHFNRSTWGELVAMGLMGRHKPVTNDQRLALQAFISGKPLIMPPSGERLWYESLPQESKEWALEELDMRATRLIGNVQAYLEDPDIQVLERPDLMERLVADRDDIQCVLWLMDICGGGIIECLDELASLLPVLPTSDEQILRAGTDYPDMWWARGIPDLDGP